MDFQPQFIVAGLLPLLARGVVRVMPRKWRKHRRVAGLGLWGSAKELRRHFDDTEQAKDRHTHWVAIEGASAILTRLVIPCPPKKASSEIWRTFLAHIVTAAVDGDASRGRAVLSRPDWKSLDDHSGFAERSPAPASIGDQTGPSEVSVEERIFTSKTAAELFASIEHLTQLEMERVIAPHIGKWIRVQSVIQDMRSDDDFVVVWIGGKFEPTPVLSFEKDAWSARLETMSRGTPLAACGRIQKIGLMAMVLVDCEIVDVEGENDTFRRPSPRRAE